MKPFHLDSFETFVSLAVEHKVKTVGEFVFMTCLAADKYKPFYNPVYQPLSQCVDLYDVDMPLEAFHIEVKNNPQLFKLGGKNE